MSTLLLVAALLGCMHLAQGQVLCGGKVCHPGADCINGFCACRAGSAGDGRFLCYPTASSCGCIAFGDPVTKLFDQSPSRQQVRSILPCTYTFASLTNNNAATVGALPCAITVRVDVASRNPSNPFRMFNQIVRITATRDNTQATATLRAGGATVGTNTAIVGAPDANAGLNDVTLVPSRDSVNYQTITATPCGFSVRFNPSQYALTLEAPNAANGGVYTKVGLCRDCNGVSDDIPFTLAPSINDLAASVRALSTTQTTPQTADCGVISAAGRKAFCLTDANLQNAARACGNFVLSPYSDCLRTTGGISAEGLLGAFKDCVNLYCNGGTGIISACAIVNSIDASVPGCTLPAGYVCS